MSLRGETFWLQNGEAKCQKFVISTPRGSAVPTRDWLERVSIHKARCHVCKKVVDISNMGESAQKSYQGNQTRALDTADGGRFPFANYRIFWIGEHIGTSRYRNGYLFMK